MQGSGLRRSSCPLRALGGPRGRSEPWCGKGRGRPTDRRRVQTRGSRSCLDEVAEDPADLVGISDDGEHSHLASAAGAAQGAFAGSRLLSAMRSTSQVFASSRVYAARDCLAETDCSGFTSWGSSSRRADRWLVLLPPARGSQAHGVGLAPPRHTGAEGLQAVATGSGTAARC